LKELHRRGIIKRRLVEKGWIGYVYRAEDPREVVAKLKSQILAEFGKLEKILESF